MTSEKDALVGAINIAYDTFPTSAYHRIARGNDENTTEGGVLGMVEAVLANAHEKHQSLSEGRRAAATAFSKTTSSWNHHLRGLFARKEKQRLEEMQDNGDDIPMSYYDEICYFVRNTSVSMSDIHDVELGDYYDLSEEYSKLEVKAILLARVYGVGEDADDFLDQVDDLRNFCRELGRTEDISAALNRERFDSQLPPELLTEVAPPEEWPPDMDPSNIRQQSCDDCMTTTFDVFTDNGTETLSSNGNTLNIHRTNTTEGDIYNLRQSSNGDARICEICIENYKENGRFKHLFISGEKAMLLREMHGFGVDVGGDGFSDFSDLHEAELNSLRRLVSGSASDRIILSADDAPNATANEMTDAIRDAMGQPDFELSDNVRAVFRTEPSGFENNPVGIFPPDSFESAQFVKELLESQAMQQTNEDLGELFGYNV